MKRLLLPILAIALSPLPAHAQDPEPDTMRQHAHPFTNCASTRCTRASACANGMPGRKQVNAATKLPTISAPPRIS